MEVSAVTMYVEPYQNWTENEGIDPDILDLSWSVLRMEEYLIQFKIKFNHSLEVSPMVERDKLVIEFN